MSAPGSAAVDVVRTPRTLSPALQKESSSYRSASHHKAAQAQFKLEGDNFNLNLCNAVKIESSAASSGDVLRTREDKCPPQMAKMWQASQEMSIVVSPPPPLPEELDTDSNLVTRLSAGSSRMDPVKKKLEQKSFEVKAVQEVGRQLSEIRHQVTTELLQVKTGFDQKLQKAFSANRVANGCLEEQLKRMILLQEMSTAKVWQQLHDRISVLEHDNTSMLKDSQLKLQEQHHVWVSLQRQVNHVAEAFELLGQDTHKIQVQLKVHEERLNTMPSASQIAQDASKIQEQLRAQEERLSNICTPIKALEDDFRDDCSRQLSPALSTQLDRELDLFSQHVHEKSLWKMEHLDKLDVLHAKFDVLQSHLLTQEQAQEEFRMNLLAGGSDAEGKHAELRARLLELEAKAAGLEAARPQEVEMLASRMEGIEKAISDVSSRAQEREGRVLESMQRATEAAGQVAEVGKAITRLTEENVADRLTEIEDVLGSSRGAQVEQVTDTASAADNSSSVADVRSIAAQSTWLGHYMEYASQRRQKKKLEG